ncbi:MAG: hypothetical protein A2017_20885 [Lentisphaerae bacterium GWF2_44_16]|nr:MAG: hypothetical protein A2017_20885 [Lentisphaerae bacterium GWF2_44_16]
MKSLTFSFFTVCLLLVSVTIKSEISSSPTTIKNPGFEEIDKEKQLPKDWTVSCNKKEQELVQTTHEHCSGTYGVELRGNGNMPKNRHVMISQPFPAKGEYSFILRCNLKTIGNGQALFDYAAYDKNNKLIKREYSTGFRNVNEWSSHFWRFKTPPGTEKVRVSLRNAIVAEKGPGSVFYDDVSIQEVGDVLENKYIKAVIDPLVGGRINSLIFKKTGTEMTHWQGPSRAGGLAGDIFPSASYPGELRDVIYDMETVKSNSNIRLTHTFQTLELKGLLFEKTISLADDDALINIHITIKNLSEKAKKISFRTQQCIPAQKYIFTWPCTENILFCNRKENFTSTDLWIENMNEGWIGAVDPVSKTAVAFLLDQSKLLKAYSHFSTNTDTVEWWYKELEIPSGAAWETAYAIALTQADNPLVSVSQNCTYSLFPLKFRVKSDYLLGIAPFRKTVPSEISIKGITAEDKQLLISEKCDNIIEQIKNITLPWKSEEIKSIEINDQGKNIFHSAYFCEISHWFQEEKGVTLPDPLPETRPFHEIADYFPLGGYIDGLVCLHEIGSYPKAWNRLLRQFRRNYFNTATGTLIMQANWLKDFQKTGLSWMGDLCRKYNIKYIPRMETMPLLLKRGKIPFLEKITPEQIRTECFKEGIYEYDLIKSFAKKYNDIILAYDISDEPRAQCIPMYMAAQTVFKDINPDRPAIPILNMSTQQYLPYVPIYYGDHYPIHIKDDRNPWDVARVVRTTALKKKASVWVMLQAFGWGRWTLPSSHEIRYMTWAVVVNGGKGITYHGITGHPRWRYNAGYDLNVLDRTGTYTEQWKELGTIGKYLTAIAPVLLESDIEENKAFTAEADEITTHKSYYRGPAITASALKQRNGKGYFLALQNQDIEKSRKGILHITKEMTEGKILYDLHNLKEANSTKPINLEITLRPGDAHFFYCGPKEEALKISMQVHKNHYLNESVLYNIDAELAASNGINITAANAKSELASSAYTKEQYEDAHRLILEAHQNINLAIKSNPDFAQKLADIDTIHSLLSEIIFKYNQNLKIIIPPEVQKATPKYKQWAKNDKDPLLQNYLDKTSDYLRESLELEDRIYAGEPVTNNAVTELLKKTKQLHGDAIPYVLKKKTDTDKEKNETVHQ